MFMSGEAARNASTRRRAAGNLAIPVQNSAAAPRVNPEFRAKNIWRLQFRATGHQSSMSGALRTCKAKVGMQGMAARGDSVSQVIDACAARSGGR
jgi:hypothetical protein